MRILIASGKTITKCGSEQTLTLSFLSAALSAANVVLSWSSEVVCMAASPRRALAMDT